MPIIWSFISPFLSARPPPFDCQPTLNKVHKNVPFHPFFKTFLKCPIVFTGFQQEFKQEQAYFESFKATVSKVCTYSACFAPA